MDVFEDISLTQWQIDFSVYIESSQSLPNVPWDVSLWYCCSSVEDTKYEEWTELALKRGDSIPDSFVSPQINQPAVYKYSFSGSIARPGNAKDSYKAADEGLRVSFTLKYRAIKGFPWQWVNTIYGTPDGTVILPSSSAKPALNDILRMPSGWNVSELSSECSSARLFKITSKDFIPRVKDQTERKVLGSIQELKKWFALIRIWSPWLGPRHGNDRLFLSEDALLLSFLNKKGQTVVLLPMNGIDDTLTLFESNELGEIVVAARDDSTTDHPFYVLAAVASDFEVANSAVMYEARKVVRASAEVARLTETLPRQVSSESLDSETVLVSKSVQDPPPMPEWLHNWYDGLAYCTWNSLGQDLNIEKIMSGLDSLAKIGIHVSTLIIDDNWQSLSGEQGVTSQFQRGWERFEATTRGFPNGLKDAISKIRAKHPQLQDIAVWHALMGYWGGIAANSELSKNYKTIEVSNTGGIAGSARLAIHPDEIHRMYEDFYSFLSSCGITSVKTDVQFYLDLMTSSSDRRLTNTAYQSAWTIAHLRHFGGKAISCMSQIPQILFHSFLPTSTPRVLLRNSDDFFPDIPESHPWHVFCNAHNALFVQHLNVLPDWDMFQTSHPYSGFHAASRCVSGGPIYITDTPGEHNVELIHQISAKDVQGRTIILRPSMIGKTLDVWNNYNDGHILKVGTYNGAAESGSGILGLFNVSNHEISFMAPVTDIPGVKDAIIRDNAKFVVGSFQTGKVTGALRPSVRLEPKLLFVGSLPVRGWDILTAYPVHTTAEGKEVAVMGLLGKMTGVCAVESTSWNVLENGRLKIRVVLKAVGKLGVWVSEISARDVDEKIMVEVYGKAVERSRVGVRAVGGEGAESKAGILEVELHGIEPPSKWTSEVVMEIFIGK